MGVEEILERFNEGLGIKNVLNRESVRTINLFFTRIKKNPIHLPTRTNLTYTLSRHSVDLVEGLAILKE